MFHGVRNGIVLLIGLAWLAGLGAAAGKADPLLDEIVDFAGQVFFIQTKVPGLVRGGAQW
jgi:hypothetical protein